MINSSVKNVDRSIEGIWSTIIDAELHHDVWWTYLSKETRQKFIDVIDIYDIFFQVSTNAHFIVMLIAFFWNLS